MRKRVYEDGGPMVLASGIEWRAAPFARAAKLHRQAVVSLINVYKSHTVVSWKGSSG